MDEALYRALQNNVTLYLYEWDMQLQGTLDFLCEIESFGEGYTVRVHWRRNVWS